MVSEYHGGVQHQFADDYFNLRKHKKGVVPLNHKWNNPFKISGMGRRKLSKASHDNA